MFELQLIFNSSKLMGLWCENALLYVCNHVNKLTHNLYSVIPPGLLLITGQALVSYAYFDWSELCENVDSFEFFL